MYLLFPNLQTLQIALTSGLIPAEVASAPAEYASNDEGLVWVKASRKIDASTQDELKQLGVSFRKSTRGAGGAVEPVTCWPQILPLEKLPKTSTQQEGLGERTPVLFVLPESANLADVVSEILRLGNDRQSFRQQKTDEGVRTLLLVKGPPYYTLLRAIDQLDGNATPRAYVEQSPGVWVELGYRHPLAEQIQSEKNAFLLLGAPREWTPIAEGKFHDIYEALRFTIPGKPLKWETEQLEEKLKVRLRLVRGGTEEAAEFWVLNEAGVSQLEELVQSADDRLVARLAFAVGTSPNDAGQRTVIVKIRPGKEPPPVLVLDGIACRSYLRLPNLFLPIGYRLHPPLRRDAVKKLLAADTNLNTWLLPGEDGQFIPQSLPDSAFRPLTDWVDYVVDSNRESLKAWSEAMQFDFESFICPDEGPDRSSKAKKPRRDTERTESSSKESNRLTKPAATKTKPNTQKATQTTPTQEADSQKTAILPPNELQLKLVALEKQFRELPEPVYSPARRDLWRELAETNMALGHKAEGALCFANGIWDEATPSRDWIREWYETEMPGEPPPPMTGEKFDAALSTERPTPTQLNLLAIHVIAAAFAEPALPDVAHDSLSAVQKQLERFENFLPLRTAWLAWLACAKIAHDDVLALARTRDRVLERLHEYGPSPEMDLPAFLRSTGPRTGERFRAVKQTMSELRGRAQAWIKRELEHQPFGGKGQTPAYADLMIAYGYARVGLRQDCEDLLEETEAKLLSPPIRNDVHEWFLQAFRHRISQSLEGQGPSGTLPDELTRPLAEKTLDSGLIFAIDSLRSKSRIIQPFEQVDSRTRFIAGTGSKSFELAIKVEQLANVENRIELAEGIRLLLEAHGSEAIIESVNYDLNNQSLLTGVLQFAPRLGDSQAAQLLEQVPNTLEQLAEPGQQAALLERALFVAAHFGHPAQVRHFVEQLHSLVETEGSPETAEAFATLLGQSFRGLRKLGMRGEISSLLDHIDRLDQDKRFEPSAAVPQAKKTKSIKRANAAREHQLLQELNTLTLRLNVAAGWFYFGNNDRAEKIVEQVSRFLYQENALKPHLKRKLVRRFAQVLEHAPIELAIPKLNEVFDRLTGITKGLGAGLHDEHYAYEFLEVIDSIVLALVSDEMTLDPKAREIMDDLEFSIRQRIHRDMERAQLANEF